MWNACRGLNIVWQHSSSLTLSSGIVKHFGKHLETETENHSCLYLKYEASAGKQLAIYIYVYIYICRSWLVMLINRCWAQRQMTEEAAE